MLQIFLGLLEVANHLLQEVELETEFNKQVLSTQTLVLKRQRQLWSSRNL